MIPCNANAPLEADTHVRLLLNEETVALSSSAECLRFETAETIAEEGRSGVDGGKESSSLESGLSLRTGMTFAGVVGGPISPPMAMTVLVLLLGAVKVELEIAPRDWSEGRKALAPFGMCLTMMACKRSKCGNPFDLNGAASLCF